MKDESLAAGGKRHGLRVHRTVRGHQRLPEERPPGHGQAAIGHLNGPVRFDRLDETSGEILRRHEFQCSRQKNVLRHFDLKVDNDPKQPVTAHGEGKQFRVSFPRAGLDRAVGQHQAQ